jgi:hypothetical protein
MRAPLHEQAEGSLWRPNGHSGPMAAAAAAAAMDRGRIPLAPLPSAVNLLPMAGRRHRDSEPADPDSRVIERVAALDWDRIRCDLDRLGHARIPGLLRAAECRGLTRLYSREECFRKVISMERHRFGEGEYKYFSYPLPPLVAGLRSAFHPWLAPIANRWQEQLGALERFPATHAEFLADCHSAGQERPTPLLLHYRSGGYNRLHQDIYGAIAFPLQLACLLSRSGEDFSGGEFLLTEQRPRMQSRGEAIALERGEGIVFPTRTRPVEGARGHHRAIMRHGVSRIAAGERTTLGIIFHDAT